MADLLSLRLATSRMGAHVEPNLEDVSNWNAISDDRGAEDGFPERGNPHKNILSLFRALR